MKSKLFNPLVIFSICFFVFLTGAGFSGNEQFVTLGGKPVSYQELVSSPNTVLFVWTTWCPSCRATIGDLTQKCVSFDNVKLLYINTAEKKSTVMRFLRPKKLKQCIKDNMILDSKGAIARQFSVFAIPTFIFLERGKFVYKSNFLNRDLLNKVFNSR